MPYRMIAAVIALAALNLAAAPAAPAQSVADADNALHAMDLRMRALNADRKKLQQMEFHRNDLEADAVRDVTEADSIVFTAAVKVFTVAFIMTGMKSPEDFRFTQKQFRLVVQQLVTSADAQLVRIDESLRNLATPTARAEAVNIRDVIVDLRDFLKPFAAEQ
jgi:hypothetical protein